ncbi:hypothetical protein [Butyrivibrio proteoclasticus]|uniref:hypothetical protein n=1 Tax=Butyrivibrio proteoclasticus TaxID=43305 RepID=UPI0006886310|nr:hypothetical protein [Butyrivibrio proteoclasticus]
MIKKNLLRSISVIMACMMAVMTVACGSNTVATEDTASAVETRQEQQLEKSIVAGAQAAGSLGEAGKVETVYVTADASGSVNDVIVSEWLKNATASSELTDTTELKDIVNVKGDESFTENGDGTVTWNADGSDIYYQGTTDKELPVDMKITYTLDGKEISPADLAGKSGKVTIRFEYENKAKQTVDVDGKNIDVYTPFAMVSGMMLDSDKFSNVEISNGKIISDGGNYIVMGVALPGLKESLDISDDKWDELDDSEELKDKLSNAFEITADTTDFELGMTITMASSDILSDFGISDLSDSDKIDDLKDDMNELNDGSDKLVDGAGELKDGTSKLKDGTVELKDGTGKLYDGTKELKDGTGKLVTGTGKLADGAGQLVTGAGQLADGTNTLKDGTGKLADGSNTLYNGIVAYTDGVSKVNSGAGELAKGVASAKEGSKAVVGGIKQVEGGADAVVKGAEQVNGGVNAAVGEIKKMLVSLETGTKNLYDQKANCEAAYAYLTTPGIPCSEAVADTLSTLTKGKVNASNAEEVKAAGLRSMAGTNSGEVSQETNGAELDEDVEGGVITPAPDNNEEEPSNSENTPVNSENTPANPENTPANPENTPANPENTPANPENTPANPENITPNNENSADEESQGNPEGGYTQEQVDQMVQDAVNAALVKAQEEFAAKAQEEKEAAEAEFEKKAEEIKKAVTAKCKEEFEKQAAAKMSEATKEAANVALYYSAYSSVSATIGTLDQVIAQLTSTGVSEEQLQLLDNLVIGTGKLYDGTKQLQAGLGQLDAGAVELDGGLGKLSTGANTLATGIGTLASNSSALRDGASQLKSGAGQLNDGAGQLRDGANKLSDGTKELKSGTDELNSGAKDLDTGAGKLVDGAGQLDDGAKELNDGAAKLDDGVQELLDGICKFDEEGIKKLYEAFDGDLTEFADKMTAIQEAGSNYTSFGGASTEEKSSVKFIIKTEGVKAQDI